MALSFSMQSSEDDLHSFTEQATSTGMLTVMDLDRQTAILATRFKRWAATHGPLRQLCFGTDNVVAQLGKVVLPADFVAVCRRTGFDGSDEDFTELYGLCDPSESGIRPIDLLFLEPDPQVKEQEEQRLRILRMGQREQKQHLMAEVFQEEKARQVSAKHRLAPRPWQAIDFEHLPKIVCERQHDWQMAAEKRAEEARMEFTLYLRKAYGNEVRAWRRALDPNATYRLTLRGLRKFFHAELNVRVDQGALWKALDQDGVGHVGIEDVAPRHSHVLAHFRQFLRDRLGSCASAWDHPAAVAACLSPQRDGRRLWKSTRKLLLGPFLKVIREIGWPLVANPDARSLLLASLDYFGCAFVSRSDLEWLDGWQPPEWMNAEPDEEAVECLRDLVQKRFGHPLSAWRSLFDRDDSNSVSWLEFREACEKLRFQGSIGGAWRALDTDLSGHISLQEFDADSARILMSFKAWCMKHFGSINLMFRALDRDGSGSLQYLELKRACKRFRWTGDVYLLFNCLDVDGARSHGKRNISLQELHFLDSWEMTEEMNELPKTADESQKRADAEAEAAEGHGGPRSPSLRLPELAKSPSSPARLPSLPPVATAAPARDDSLERSWMNHLKAVRAAEASVPKKKPPSKFLQRFLQEYGAEGLLK